jgi:hypothetical protein
MSEDVGLHRWTLPPDWRDRRVLVCSSGSLRVYAAGRLDLLTMKFIAHRGVDIEHLSRMSVRNEELDFIRQQLDRLAHEHRVANEGAQIERARQLVDSWSST